MPSEEAKLKVLHAHYVDTYSEIKATLKERNNLFLLILTLITVMLLQIVAPQESERALSQVVASKLGFSESINISVIGSVIWFSLLWLLVRYFQAVAHGERLIKYIHIIEEQLGKIYDYGAFTREGHFYLSNYGTFSKWLRILYTIAFPGLLVAVIAVKLWTEFTSDGCVTFQHGFDASVGCAILVSTALYLCALHGSGSSGSNKSILSHKKLPRRSPPLKGNEDV